MKPQGPISTAFPLGTVKAALVFSAVLFATGCVSIPPSLALSPRDASLARRTARIAGKTGARFGVSALHVESGRRMDWNAGDPFEGASAIKLAILAEAAARVAESRLDLNDRWKLTAKAVAAGSGWLDEFDPGLMPTNRDLLRLMIAVSDNTAANLFIDRFGAAVVNARMEKLGLPGIRLVGRIPDHDREPDKWPPLGSMTPRDTAEYLRRAATGTLLGPEPDRLILDMLRTQHTKDRLFRLLDRKGNTWAGKSGTYGGVRNDAGILTTPKGRFVLVMFVDRIPEGATTPARLAMGEIAAAIVSAWSASLPDLPAAADEKPPRALQPALPRLEISLAEARGNPDGPFLARVFRDTDRRFWDLYAAAGGDTRETCLIPMPNSWWEGFAPWKIEPVSALILHHTSMDTDEQCIALFQKPESGVSSHFLVGRDGRLFQFVSLEHRSWHAGPSLLHGRVALNRTSIGVEITGDGNRYPFTRPQIETVVRLVGTLTALFDVPAPWIAGHQHIAPDRKDDPGELFPWNEIERRALALAERLKDAVR